MNAGATDPGRRVARGSRWPLSSLPPRFERSPTLRVMLVTTPAAASAGRRPRRASYTRFPD